MMTSWLKPGQSLSLRPSNLGRWPKGCGRVHDRPLIPCAPKNPRENRRSHRSGVTIIEVLGALVLLGTVLASILTAQGRFIKQLASAERRLEATKAADQLLTLWWQDRAKFPRSGSGSVNEVVKGLGDSKSGLMWQMTTLENRDFAVLGIDVVRLEIFDSREKSTTSGTASNRNPLARVEILLSHQVDPAPPDSPAQTARSNTPIQLSHESQGGRRGF